jgi:hypothetical protein
MRPMRRRQSCACSISASWRHPHPRADRWQLRGAVKVVNQVLGALDLEKHPAKTFIGRIERGFDVLGYHFSREGLAVAKAMTLSG